MGEGSGGSTVGGQRAKKAHSVLRHLGAMHVSGAVLLLTFLMPPLWMSDAAYATPPDDPTADAPYLVLLAAPVLCAGFHVLVQIPAGLLAVWLGRGHTAPVRYGGAVVVAGVLSLLLLRGLVWDSWEGVMPAWGDLMVRGSLGLAGYMGVMRARPDAVRHARG